MPSSPDLSQLNWSAYANAFIAPLGYVLMAYSGSQALRLDIRVTALMFAIIMLSVYIYWKGVLLLLDLEVSTDVLTAPGGERIPVSAITRISMSPKYLTVESELKHFDAPIHFLDDCELIQIKVNSICEGRALFSKVSGFSVWICVPLFLAPALFAGLFEIHWRALCAMGAPTAYLVFCFGSLTLVLTGGFRGLLSFCLLLTIPIILCFNDPSLNSDLPTRAMQLYDLLILKWPIIFLIVANGLTTLLWLVTKSQPKVISKG